MNRYLYYASFDVLGQTKEEYIDEINLQEQTLNIPIADIDEINLQEQTLNIPIADIDEINLQELTLNIPIAD